VKPRETFLSFRGRLARAGFLSALLLAAAAFALLFALLERAASPRSALVLYPPFFWLLAALSVKRLHDRARSARWLLLAIVPLLGPLWLLAELALLPGTAGENRYGPDPLAPAGDYLVVR